MQEGFKSLLLHNVKIRMNTGKFSVRADFLLFWKCKYSQILRYKCG